MQGVSDRDADPESGCAAPAPPTDPGQSHPSTGRFMLLTISKAPHAAAPARGPTLDILLRRRGMVGW